VNGDTISVTYSSSATATSPVGGYAVVATLVDPGNKLSNYAVNSTNGTLTITQATPVLTWAAPTRIFAGMPLSATQLNAQAFDPTSNLALQGAYLYTPAAATVLAPGANQTLQVLFTPQDALNYTMATLNNALIVDPALPVSITSALNASGQKDVSFSYSITSDGSAPIIFTATGLPAGLTLTGTVISGSPTVTGIFFVSLTATNYANSDARILKLTVTQSGVNHAPVIGSPPTVSANPALTGAAITLSAAATDADGDNLDYEWDFGDGTTGSGASVTKKYSAAGVYIIKLNVSDGQASDSQNVNVVVNDQAPIGTFAVTKVLVAFAFTKPGSDFLTLSGQIPVPTGFNAAGKNVRLVIGSLDKSYVLTSKGASADKAFTLTGKPTNGAMSFVFSVKKQDLFTRLEDLGFSKTANNPSLAFPVVIVLDTASYIAQPTINYQVKSSKTGPQIGMGKK
jgi:PKD repeat protein